MSNGFLAGFNKLFGAGKSKESRNKKQQEQQAAAAAAAAASANGDNNSNGAKSVESPPNQQTPQHNRSPSGVASSLSPSHASSSASGSASSSSSSSSKLPVSVLERLPSISGEEGRQAAPTAKPLTKTPSSSGISPNTSSSASIAASAAAAAAAAVANHPAEPPPPSASSSAASSRRTSGHMQSLLSPSHASGSSSSSNSPRPSPSDHSPLSNATPADSTARAVSQPAADVNPSDGKFVSGVSRNHQKRAISDPLANLLASISSHLPIKEKDQPICPKHEGYAVLEDNKVCEEDPSQLEARMGSDVGIHRQSDSSTPSSSTSSSHNHHHHHHQHTHNQSKKAPLGLTHLVPSFPPSSTTCTDENCCCITTSSSSSSGSTSTSSSTSSTNTTAAVALQDLLKKMQYSSIDTMLSAGGATMPASVRTHLEKKLIAYKLANHHASVAAQQHHEAAQAGTATTTSSGSALQRSHTTGNDVSSASTAAAHCTPTSAFFSLKSLFQPSSSPQQYAPFQPPTAASAAGVSDNSPSPHMPVTGVPGVPPSIPLSSSSSALAASASSPSPSPSFTPAQQRFASRSLSRDSTETTPRREGEPEVSSPLSPSLKSASPLVSGASLAEIDGHWSSTHASRRIKKVSKKPSFALSGSGSSNPSISSLDEFVHVNPSSPLSASSGNVSRSIPGGAAPDFSLNNSVSAGLGAGEWKRIDDISETDRRTLERGLSKLEAHSSSRSASLGSGTILAPHSALAQLQLEHASSATSTPSPPIFTSNPSVATPASSNTSTGSNNAATTPSTTASSGGGSVSSLPSSPADWSVGDVQRFLHSLGLQEHAPRFERSTIDGEMLITLSEEDLTELGVSDRFHRRKLLKKLNSLLPVASKKSAEMNGDIQTRPTSASASAALGINNGSGSRSNPKSSSRPNKGSGRSASTAQADSTSSFSAASSTASSSSSIASSGSARRRRTSSSDDDDDTDDDVEEGEDVAPLMRRGGDVESTQQLLEDYDTSDVDSIYVSREQVERMLRHLQLRSYRSKNKKNKKAMSDFNGSNKDAIAAASVSSSSSISSSSSKPSHKHSDSSKVSSGSSRTLHASVKKKNKNRSRDPEATATATPVDPYHAWQAEDSSSPAVFNNARQSSQSLSQHGGAPSNNGIQSLVSSSNANAAAVSPAHHLSIISLNDIHSLRHLNEGTAGVAYVGRYDNKNVVVKQPKKKVIGSEEWLELQLHMSIPAHPNVIPFIGICMVQVQMYLVTEFIERGSLKSLLSLSAEQGGIELRRYYSHPLQLIRAAAEIGRGLQHLHEHHIVHRDVAARNILVTAEGQHILSDFGLSRWMEKRERNALRSNGAVSESKEQLDPADETEFEDVYTMHSLTALPARWTSPESLRSQSFNAASDVYSLGLVMFEMLSGGSLPYNQVKDNLQVIAGIVTNELKLEFPKDASPEVVAFIRRAMEPVETRPSMKQLLAEMEQFIKNQMELYNEQFLAQQQQQQQQEQQPQQVEEAQVKQAELQEPVVFQQGDLFANLEQLQPLVINEKSSH